MKSSRIFWVPSRKYLPLPRWKSLTTTLYLGRGLSGIFATASCYAALFGRLRLDLRDAHAVAGSLFRVVHRLIRGIDDRFLGLGVVRKQRNPDRHGEMYTKTLGLKKRARLDGLPDSFRDGLCRDQIARTQDRDE